MPEIDILRAELIEELWLPIVKEAGGILYSRRKKKRMKLFTLTDGMNFRELKKFEEEELIQRGDAIIWVSGMIKAFRAESESRGVVLHGSIFGEPLLIAACRLQDRFPCDVLNLDFSSQEYYGDRPSIEQEIEKIEQFINLQNQKRVNGFALLITTMINSEQIDTNLVKSTSDSLIINGWSGLDLGEHEQTISDNNQKIEFVKHFTREISQKYSYRVSQIKELNKSNLGNCEQLSSITGIFER